MINIYIRATPWQNLLLPYANNKGADQPARPRSLISTFVVHFVDSIIPLVFISEISSLYLASLAAQACLYLTWLQTPKTGFLLTRLIHCQCQCYHCFIVITRFSTLSLKNLPIGNRTLFLHIFVQSPSCSLVIQCTLFQSGGYTG